MARVSVVDRSALGDLEPIFGLVEENMGFLPNSMLTMAHNPALVQTFGAFAATVLAPGKVGEDLKALLSFVVSRSAGCNYCMAHTGHTSVEKRGIAQEKLEAVWEFETSDLFSDAERAALVVAQGAGQVPNAVTDEDFAALKQHFSDEQIVEIVAVISLFGFLNRWNDTMATELESSPLNFAQKAIGDKGWQVGKHA